MKVTSDQMQHQVILQGERFQVSMTWAAAAHLSTLLNEASRQAEPASAIGKRYHPVMER